MDLRAFLKPTKRKFLYFFGILAPFFVTLFLYIVALFTLTLVIFKPIEIAFVFFASIVLLPTFLTAFGLSELGHFVFPELSNVYPYFKLLGDFAILSGFVTGVLFWWVVACFIEKNKKIALLLIVLAAIIGLFFFPVLIK